jgi:tRNA (guanine37-N1)-methyltransferase
MEAFDELSKTLIHGCPVYLAVMECRRHAALRPPVSYVLVGRVAIVSLDERIIGREMEIARRLLETVPGIEAVYAKKATVGEYRVQELIHIGGRKVEKTLHVENGLRIPVPIGRVYFNPRLATEHVRIAKAVEDGDRVLDMFAGVGGFTLNIATRGKAEIVVANDINTYATTALVEAITLNKKLLKTPVVVLNEDAKNLPTILKPVFTRIIMNLPHGALEFLPLALELCEKKGCTIHVYTVARSVDEAMRAVEARKLPITILGAIRVLDYAPGKYIFRVDIKYNMEDEAAGKA